MIFTIMLYIYCKINIVDDFFMLWSTIILHLEKCLKNLLYLILIWRLNWGISQT